VQLWLCAVHGGDAHGESRPGACRCHRRRAGRPDDPETGEVADQQKVALGALHLRKIDLADRVLAIKPGGSIGESTSREIAYAHAAGKPVSFSDPV
jgi:hypothetical protein